MWLPGGLIKRLLARAEELGRGTKHGVSKATGKDFNKTVRPGACTAQIWAIAEELGIELPGVDLQLRWLDAFLVLYDADEEEAMARLEFMESLAKVKAVDAADEKRPFRSRTRHPSAASK